MDNLPRLWQRARFLSTVIAACTLMLSATTQSVELRFDWKPGMTCEVVNHMTKEGADRPRPVTLRYTMRVLSAGGSDLLVRVENPTIDAEKSIASKEGRELAAAYLAAANMPPFRVRASGDLIGLDDLEGTRKTLREMYEVSLPQPVDPASLDRAMSVVGSREFLATVVSLFWNPTVASWAGLEIDSGRPHETDHLGEMPFGFSARVRMTGTIELAEQTSCNRAGVQRTCVTLKATERADPADFKSFIETMMSTFGNPPDPQSRIDKLDVRQFVETTTEAETLVPHRVWVEKHMSVSGLERGKPFSQSQLERREWIFSCQSRQDDSP